MPDSEQITASVPYEGPFLLAFSRHLSAMSRVYSDQANVSLDYLFVCYLTLLARFGWFKYGPIEIDVNPVEGVFERTYQRLVLGQKASGYTEAAERFYRELAEEAARSGRRRVDELHFLLTFMRINEGLPGRVFGELGIPPESVERFNEHREPTIGTGQSRLPGLDALYSPEEVAVYLGVHPKTVRGWIKSGKLPARRLAGQRALRVRAADLELLLEPAIEKDAPKEEDLP